MTTKLISSNAGKSRNRHQRLIGARVAEPVGVAGGLGAFGGFAPLPRSDSRGIRGGGPGEEERMLRTSRPCRRKHDCRPSLELVACSMTDARLRHMTFRHWRRTRSNLRHQSSKVRAPSMFDSAPEFRLTWP